MLSNIIIYRGEESMTLKNYKVISGIDFNSGINYNLLSTKQNTYFSNNNKMENNTIKIQIKYWENINPLKRFIRRDEKIKIALVLRDNEYYYVDVLWKGDSINLDSNMATWDIEFVQVSYYYRTKYIEFPKVEGLLEGIPYPMTYPVQLIPSTATEVPSYAYENEGELDGEISFLIIGPAFNPGFSVTGPGMDPDNGYLSNVDIDQYEGIFISGIFPDYKIVKGLLNPTKDALISEEDISYLRDYSKKTFMDIPRGDLFLTRNGNFAVKANLKEYHYNV